MAGYTYVYESFTAIDVPGASSLRTNRDEDTGRYVVANGQLTLAGEKNGVSAVPYRIIDEESIQIGDAFFARR